MSKGNTTENDFLEYTLLAWGLDSLGAEIAEFLKGVGKLIIKYTHFKRR